MAKDVITRFKLETTGFDSKIKQASKELSDYSKTATQAKEGFNQFTKANVDAARALGTISTSTNNAKDKMKELVGAYNEAAKAYNQLTKEQQQSDWAKALSGSLTQLQQRIRETKQEMKGLSEGSGGIFSGDKLSGMLQVFGGNLMTKAAGYAMDFATGIGECVKEGIELAKQGEGIRIAFERLGRGDILQGLREATHGTVTDIELMKAAVKFNDFKLPLEELGTMLAFAQQKAKDTGQSVDYMVESIVTGLGRKSVMILDNLGLSAAEIKEHMKDTGDMTKAVGEIIREQMAKAGEYTETAADRATQAHVSLQNKMEELGRLYQPLQEASNTFWTSMKVSILDVVAGPLAKLLNGLTEAGSQMKMLQNANGGQNGERTRVNSQLDTLKNVRRSGSDFMVNRIYSKQVEDYNRQIIDIDTMLKQSKGVDKGSILKKASQQFGQDFFSTHELKRYQEALRTMRDQYISGAKAILNPVTAPTTPTTTTTTTTTTTPKATTTTAATEKEITIQQQIAKLEQEAYTASDERRAEIAKQVQELDKVLAAQKAIRDEVHGTVKEQQMATGISGLTPEMLASGQTDIKKQMQTVELGSEEYNNLADRLIDYNTVTNLMQEAVKSGLEVDDETREEFANALMPGGQLSQETIDGFVESLNYFNELAGENPITLNVNTGEIEKSVKKQLTDAQKTKMAWDLAGQSIQNIATAFNAIEDPGVKAMGTVIKAIADISLGFANASVQAGSLGPWGWLAWMAAGTAAMATTISTVHSLTGFAEGGEVKGNTYSGDQIPAMLNAGEVVLTRSQAGNLAEQLEDNDNRGSIGGTPYVTGEQIYLGLNNYLKGAGLGQIVTSNG